MIVRRRKHFHLNTTHETGLKLTSMMDILTTLLLFILKCSVTDGELVAPPSDVDLPASTAKELPENSVVVAVSETTISLAGEPVASVPEALADQDLLLDRLDAQLVETRERMERLAEAAGAAPPATKVTIQGDRTIEFRLLEKVMYTCGAAGFDELALAVIQESR
jgi:biopolymer transport protein ExbD